MGRRGRTLIATAAIALSAAGPAAAARKPSPPERTAIVTAVRDPSVALLSRIRGRWTLLTDGGGGAPCDVGESRRVDNDLGISNAYLASRHQCSAPTTATQSCGRTSGGGGYPITSVRATHLTCSDAKSDALVWLDNLEIGRCALPESCRVHNSSPLLSFVCHIRPLNHPVPPYRYSAVVTCTTPLQRLAFILNNRK